MFKNKARARKIRRQRLVDEGREVENLIEIIQSQAPPPGTSTLASDVDPEAKDASEYYPNAKLFSELPLSHRTQKELVLRHFTKMTDIQRASIPHILAGRDVLGAAKTGSGKTLSFIIPLLELLYRLKWSAMDGLGALVLSPTKELALQTFNVLRTVGARHQLSAGLVIGGKNVTEEKERISKMNIIVATPGRLLQHLNETPYFSCDNLKMLVLDEADRILDMGFQKQVTAILDNLPVARQTILFSATQTANVSQLARLSLKEPEFISVHAESQFATPNQLVQNYIITPIQDKMSVLYSFLKSHKREKIMVFLSSTKEVHFYSEVFKRLKLGISISEIYGTMGTKKRIVSFQEFSKSDHAVLFTTDLSARGLDVKDIDWVIQVDCPESTETYLHRAGRTARNEAEGKATLFLLPSEVKMLENLKAKRVPITELKVPENKIHRVDKALQSILVSEPEMKDLAKKAVKTYIKSVAIGENKEVFKLPELDLEAYVRSYGLVAVPKLKFKNVDKEAMMAKQKLLQMDQQFDMAKKEDEDDSDVDLMIAIKPKKQTKTKMEKLIARGKGKDESSDEEDEESSEELFTIKKPDENAETAEEELELPKPAPLTKSKIKRLTTRIRLDKDMAIGEHLYFSNSDDEDDRADSVPVDFAAQAKEELKQADLKDRQDLKRRLKEKKDKRKQKEKAREMRKHRIGTGVQLANAEPMSGESDESGEEAPQESDESSDIQPTKKRARTDDSEDRLHPKKKVKK